MHACGPAPRSVSRLRDGALAVGGITVLVVSGLITLISARFAFAAVQVPSYDWTIDLLVTVAVACVGTLAGAWLTVWSSVSILFFAGASLGRRVHRVERFIARRGPAVLRRLIVVSIGAGMSLTAAPAIAADDGVDAKLGAVSAFAWPNSQAQPDTSQPHEPRSAHADVNLTPASKTQEAVTVQPGDTLWAIAAAHLPPGASGAEIAAAWPAWFDLNQDQIGSDPNLIHPGQQLLMPTSGP